MLQAVRLEAWVRAIGARQDYAWKTASTMCLQRMLRRLGARARLEKLLASSASRPGGSLLGSHEPTSTNSSLETDIEPPPSDGPARVAAPEELEREPLERGDGQALMAEAKAEMAVVFAAIEAEDAGIGLDDLD